MSVSKIDIVLLNRITDFYKIDLGSKHMPVCLTINDKFVQPGNCIWLSFGEVVPADLDGANKHEIDSFMSKSKVAVFIDPADLVDKLCDDKDRSLEFRNRPKLIKRQNKAAADAQAICDKAFGVIKAVFSTSMDNDAEDFAKCLGVNFDNDASAYLGDGEYAYVVVTSQSIDDYEVMVLKTKGSRSHSDLMDYYNVSNNVHKILISNNYNLSDASIISWETGVRFKFWDIIVDKHLPTWDALKQRVEYFNDSYGGD